MFEYRQPNLPKALYTGKKKKTQKRTLHINSKSPPQGQSDEAVVVVPVVGNKMRQIIANRKLGGEFNSRADKRKNCGVDIENIPTIPISVGQKGRGLHALRSKWHLIMAFFFPGMPEDIVKIYIFKYMLTFFLPPLLCSLVIRTVIESIYFLISPRIE